MATISLTDGTSVDTSDILFDPGSYTFTLNSPGGASDITNNITIGDKETYWPSFDTSIYNNILYSRQYQSQTGVLPPPVGSTSVLDNFFSQLYNDPLGAPIEQANTIVANTASDVANSPALTSAVSSITTKVTEALLLVGGVALLILLWPEIKATTQAARSAFKRRPKSSTT